MLTISEISAFVFVSTRICDGWTYSYLGGDTHSADRYGKADGEE